MTSINFKVSGLIQPGFENQEVWTRTIRLPNLPEREADALLIQTPQLFA